jgi:tight adherence protein C
MDALTSLNDMLVTKFGPLGPLFAVGLLGILLVLIVLPSMLKKKPEPFDKLKAMRTKGAAPEKGPTLRRGEKVDKLEKFATFLEPQDAEQMSASRLKMLRAGYKNKNAVRMFHFAQFSLGIGALVAGLVYTMIISQHQEGTTQFRMLATIIPGGAGYYLPQYWVQRRLQERQKQIIQGFPDALDLMLVCVEAGQSLDQSINRMARETRAGYPALSDQDDQQRRHGEQHSAKGQLRRQGTRAGAARHVRTGEHSRRLLFRHHAGAIGKLWYVHCRGAPDLFGGNA